MTCLVGLVDGDRVWMGADGLGSTTCGAYPRSPESAKLFRRGEMLIAWSGEPRVGQIVEHALDIPEHPDDLATMAYLVSRFVPAVRKALTDGGWVVEWRQEHPTWSLLIGYRGRLYELYSTFQIDTVARPYIAIGCGNEFAQGSFYSTTDWRAEDRVRMALETAAEHDIHVGAPFAVESIA